MLSVTGFCLWQSTVMGTRKGMTGASVEMGEVRETGAKRKSRGLGDRKAEMEQGPTRQRTDGGQEKRQASS